MVNVLVMPPPSTLTAHPLEPPLGAVMAQGPITYGLPGVPFPAVTQAHPVGEPVAVKPVSDVMVIAPCCAAPAGPATRADAGAPTATATAVTARKTKRRIRHLLWDKDQPRATQDSRRVRDSAAWR